MIDTKVLCNDLGFFLLQFGKELLPGLKADGHEIAVPR